MSHRRTVLALAVALALAVPTGLAGSAPAGGQAPPEGGLPAFALDPVAELDDAVAMAARPGTDQLYVAEREGIVRRLVPNGSDFDVSPLVVLDIRHLTTTESERGLLGLTFNRAGTKLYVHHTNNNGDTRIAEYRMAAGGTGLRALAGTRRVVLSVNQPQPNHNGGTITFGPDNRLYIALGDGGGAGDPRGNGQNLTRLLGKVLRINPNASRTAAYTAPGTNPFVGQAPRRKEIWLYGVRNPWRISFDQDTGDLYVADVGQGEREEVDILLADGDGLDAGRRANLGWRRMEGTVPYGSATAPGNHTPPAFEYDHDGGRCSIIGGHVYRGTLSPAYDGAYFFGDFCTGRIGYLVADGNGNATTTTLDGGEDLGQFTLQSFGQGNDGEVYVLTDTGMISRIVVD